MNYVYYLLDPETQELLYVGRSTKPAKRLNAFERRTDRTAMLGICQRYRDFESACQAEKKAITKHQPRYNKIVASSSGHLGRKHSIASKNQIREAIQERSLSEAGREKVRRATLGHKRNLGKRHSPETKAKIGASRRLAWERKQNANQIRPQGKEGTVASSS